MIHHRAKAFEWNKLTEIVISLSKDEKKKKNKVHEMKTKQNAKIIEGNERKLRRAEGKKEHKRNIYTNRQNK